MKVYLVGGAVRDQLLKLPVKERDWVVVGATPEQMLQQHYRQVGKDFPVFLHPQTQEEYALARKERKDAPGYYGFSCEFGQDVTLKEDLARRDLTINAIAQDDKGKLIDPYGGQQDLKNRILRHVSPAFVEDPVRVLRVARFAARFHYLGFTLADETKRLIYSMTKQGELSHLVPERVWQEWQRSLEEKNPEQFINCLRACGALKILFPELDALFGIPNPQKYHYEVDSGIHTLLVLQAASELTPDPIVRFAALTHDLGKALSPMNNWPSHYGHEELGVGVIEKLCSRLRIPKDYRVLATMSSRNHLNIHRLNELRANTIVRILEQTDAFRRPTFFQKLLLVCQADAEGCGRPVQYPQKNTWLNILEECNRVSTEKIIAQGHQGQMIRQKLHEQRVACVNLILNLSEKK